MRLENIDSLDYSIKSSAIATYNIMKANNQIVGRQPQTTRISYIKQALVDTLNIVGNEIKNFGVLAIRVTKVFQGIIKLFYDPKKGVKLIALNTTLIMTGLVRLTIMTPLSKTILTLSSIAGIASPKIAPHLSLIGHELDRVTHSIEIKIKQWFEEPIT